MFVHQWCGENNPGHAAVFGKQVLEALRAKVNYADPRYTCLVGWELTGSPARIFLYLYLQCQGPNMS